MRVITNMDIKRISDNGEYLDVNNKSVRLSDDEIIAIRNYYNNNYIAKKRLALFRKIKVNLYKKKLKKRYKINRTNMGIGIIGFNKDVVKKRVYSNILGVNLVDGLIYDKNNKKKKKIKDYLSIDRDYDRDRIIKEYANIYCINYDSLYKLIARITNNFTTKEYIDGKMDGFRIRFKSEEELLLYLVRDIKLNPGKYGLYKEDIIYDRNYDYDVDYDEVIKYYSKIVGTDENLVKAIIQVESGFDSRLFNEFNNPSNMKIGSEYIKFSSKEEGIIETIIKLKGKKIENIKDINDNEYWINNVNSYYENNKVRKVM